MVGASIILAVGVAVGVVSSATQSVGLTLQRKASVAHAASHGRRSLYRSGTWQLGFALFLLANIVGSTVQIATLPLIVLAPLQSCGLLFNSLAAHYLLKERSTWLTVAATLLVILGGMVVGVVGVSASSSMDTVTHSLTQLVRLAHQRLFLRWFALTNAAVVLLLAATSCYARALPAVVKGVAYGCCSGTWSAHSLLMAKSVSDVVSHAVLQGTADLRTLDFWLLVLAFVSLALAQLFLLNKGLRHLSTSVLYPLVFCVYNLINIFNGLAFYHPPDTPLARVLAVMLPGAASLVLGVVLLSRDQYNMFQHENTAAASDPSRRTSTLSYTSLRPQSMDLSSLQSTPLSADDSDAFYISLPQATRKDKYGSVNSSKRNSRRVLSYEQEGILTQMV
ncbi:hypothetical protein ACU8KH_03766 [Lachancea thermotolerans]